MPESSDSSDDNNPLKRREFLSMSLAGAAAGLLPAAYAASAPAGSPFLKNTWQGKAVLVTGGSAGLGRATVKAFAGLGARVAFCARHESKGEEVVREVKAAGGTALFVKADVQVEADVKRLVHETVAAFGRLDIAVNNAGIHEFGEFTQQPMKNYLDVIQTNLVGAIYCLRSELAQMETQAGGGAIINILSGVVAHPPGDSPVFVASKLGLLGLTKSLSVAYGKKKVRVNAVSPGFLNHSTGSGEEFLDEKSEYATTAKKKIPRGSLISVEEVVGGILWLASEQASAVSGHNLFVDAAFVSTGSTGG